jgi:hypothetical protein
MPGRCYVPFSPEIQQATRHREDLEQELVLSDMPNLSALLFHVQLYRVKEIKTLEPAAGCFRALYSALPLVAFSVMDLMWSARAFPLPSASLPGPNEQHDSRCHRETADGRPSQPGHGLRLAPIANNVQQNAFLRLTFPAFLRRARLILLDTPNRGLRPVLNPTTLSQGILPNLPKEE